MYLFALLSFVFFETFSFADRVNIPKEIMEIPGFPFPEWNKSYITRQQCLEYLNMFANQFNLRKHIQVA